MHVDEQQILDISRDLWQTHLGLDLTPETQAESPPQEDERILSSYVKVSGSWQGAILFECPESVARHAAAMLFAADGEGTSEDDIEDALKELAEMIGKKMRTHFPEPTKISRATLGTAAIADLHGIHDVKLSCEGRPVRIAVYEAEPEPTPTVA
jgi:hypothetical protein